MIIGLCDRWHKTPDEVLAMDASALRYLAIAALGEAARGE